MQSADPKTTATELVEGDFSPSETMLDLIGHRKRRGAAVRNEFIQARGTKREPGAPGMLRYFVTDRQHFALLVYLLEHQLALSFPYTVELPAEVLARALGKTNAGAEASVSRAHAWLNERKLIEKKRTGRALEVTLLDESGNGEERKRPTGHFFTLPRAFFLDDWHTTLSMHGTVALLIALKQSYMTEWFPMPAERASVWFGISADTIRRGFAELQGHGLVESRLHEERNVRARGGKVRINQYRTLGAFQRIERPSPKKTETKPKTKAKPERKRPTRKAAT